MRFDPVSLFKSDTYLEHELPAVDRVQLTKILIDWVLAESMKANEQEIAKPDGPQKRELRIKSTDNTGFYRGDLEALLPQNPHHDAFFYRPKFSIKRPQTPSEAKQGYLKGLISGDPTPIDILEDEKQIELALTEIF